MNRMRKKVKKSKSHCSLTVVPQKCPSSLCDISIEILHILHIKYKLAIHSVALTESPLQKYWKSNKKNINYFVLIFHICNFPCLLPINILFR